MKYRKFHTNCLKIFHELLLVLVFFFCTSNKICFSILKVSFKFYSIEPGSRSARLDTQSSEFKKKSPEKSVHHIGFIGMVPVYEPRAPMSVKTNV